MKINLLKNFITDINTLNQGIIAVKRYASTIGLTLDFIPFETTKQFTSIPFSNEVNADGHIANPAEIFQECKRLGGTFDIDTVALLVYDSNKINPHGTNPSENGQNLQIPINWYVNYPDVFASYTLHELCHFFFSRAGTTDLTHRQFDPMWGNRFSQSSNIDYYLFLLKQFMKPTVTLKRTQDNGVETLGELSFENFKCKTLERPYKANLKNISAIPKGLYDVQWRFFLRKLRYAYQVQNVPTRSGIFFHSLNYVSETQGCIGLGSGYSDINFDGLTDIINSRATIATFEQLMNKKDFQLNII